MAATHNIKDGDYITILAPMTQKLNLSGNNLLVFALIHGFTKDNEHTFRGSVSYISTWLDMSKSSVIDTLKVLTNAQYISKREKIMNGVKFCEYKSNYDEMLEKLNSGGVLQPLDAKTKSRSCKARLGGSVSQHNINSYIDNNDIDILFNDKKSKDDEKAKIETKFNMKQELINLGVEEQVAHDWMVVRKQKKASNTLTAFNKIKKQIEMSNLTPTECITIAVERNWMGFEAEWVSNLSSERKSQYDRDAYVKNRIAELDKQAEKYNGKVYQ